MEVTLVMKFPAPVLTVVTPASPVPNVVAVRMAKILPIRKSSGPACINVIPILVQTLPQACVPTTVAILRGGTQT